MYNFRKQKPDFSKLEWALPIEEFKETGLRKSARELDSKYVFKIGIDLIFSILFLICALPFFIIFAILIKLTSKGPVFFKQERVGKDGKIFKIIKFRTMHNDAEKMKEDLWK